VPRQTRRFPPSSIRSTDSSPSCAPPQRACATLCAATWQWHDNPEPSSTALEALACLVVPFGVLHATSDAAPRPLVVGGSSSGKQRVNEQPSEPSQAWAAIGVRRDAGAVHGDVQRGALRKRFAPTWIDFFTTTRSHYGCEPWKRWPAAEVRRFDDLSRPPTVKPARGRRGMAGSIRVPSR